MIECEYRSESDVPVQQLENLKPLGCFYRISNFMDNVSKFNQLPLGLIRFIENIFNLIFETFHILNIIS